MTQGDAKATGSIGLATGDLFPKSEFDLANFPYGYTNNPMAEKNIFTHGHQLGRAPNFFNLSSLSIEFSLSKNMGIPGPYNGIVLRFDETKTAAQESEASDLDRILNNTDMETTMFVMRVRIPELHAHLPIPKKVVKISQNESEFDNLSSAAAPCRLRYKIDNTIMDMYPQITGYGQASNMPQLGSYVRVDFANRSSMQGGFYLGPLTDRGAIFTTQLYDMASTSFNKSAIEPKEQNITTQPEGQFNTPTVSSETQVPKPKPIEKQKKEKDNVPTTITKVTQTIIIGEEMSEDELADLEALMPD